MIKHHAVNNLFSVESSFDHLLYKSLCFTVIRYRGNDYASRT